MTDLSVIGGGSFATALVKILTENKIRISWYLRRQEQAEFIKQEGKNPDYLPFVKLDRAFLEVSNDLDFCIKNSPIILFAVPSAHFGTLCENVDMKAIQGKVVVTAIKGTVGEHNMLPSSFVARNFGIDEESQAIIAGPCHAEEIAMTKKTYMTIGSPNVEILNKLAPYFSSHYVTVNTQQDMSGAEYAAIFKNVVGVVCGMAKGLNYGDNFMAVLVSNAIYELETLLQALHVKQKRISCSSYLGDLFVTAYSAHSRNRTFGELIGRGYSVGQTQNTMKMIAEGYTATKGLYKTAKDLNINLPIVNTAYRILYNHMAVTTEFKLLERNII